MKAIEKGEKVPLNVIIENIQDIKQVEDKHFRLLEDTVNACLELSQIETGCEISITLVDNKKINEINKEFRNINAPTDVLSFPMVMMEEGRIILDEGDYNLDDDLLILGDIVISLEKAEKQAEEYGHSFERELAFLTSHGAFHLLGFDHEEEEQGKRMFDRQEEVLGKMGLGRK
jgi:probable rRNA maturation factor